MILYSILLFISLFFWFFSFLFLSFLLSFLIPQKLCVYAGSRDFGSGEQRFGFIMWNAIRFGFVIWNSYVRGTVSQCGTNMFRVSYRETYSIYAGLHL